MSSSESHTQYLHKNTDEKKRIREWERKNEIHPLAFYESFDLNDILDENISLNDSDPDESLSIDSPSRSMADNEMQIGGLIADLPNLEDNSQRKQVTISRECSCNIESDIGNIITPVFVASRQRKKVSSPAA